MRTYVAFYKDKRIVVEAESSMAAQIKAAGIFRARKRYDVTVVLADRPIDPASIG